MTKNKLTREIGLQLHTCNLIQRLGVVLRIPVQKVQPDSIRHGQSEDSDYDPSCDRRTGVR